MNIFSYDDFRVYLTDEYELRKKRNPSFSQRMLSIKIGFSSPSHFSLIFNKKLQLGLDAISKISDYFKHNQGERLYFLRLVQYDQAKTVEQREEYYNSLMSLKSTYFEHLERDKFSYFSQWYHVIVRESLDVLDVKEGDMQTLAEFIRPEITPSQAQEAIELLLRLEMVEVNASGFYKSTGLVVSSGPQRRSKVLDEYHRQFLHLASNALTEFPVGEKSHSTTTMSIDVAGYDEIVQEIKAFRSRVIEIIRSRPKSERLYQLNMSLFPLSAVKKAE